MVDSKGDLRRKAAVGTGWAAMQLGVERVLQLLIFLVVARTIGPANFGLAAIAIAPSIIIGSAIQTLSQPAATISGTDRAEERQFETICLLLGGLGTIIILALAYFVRFGDTLREMMAVAGFSSAFYSVGCVAEGRLVRNLEFRSLAIRRTSAVFIGGIACVLAAFAGFGAWAMILQLVFASLVSSGLALVTAKHTPGIDLGISWPFFRAAFNTLGGNALSQASGRLVDVVIGWGAGAPAAGLYRAARTVVDMLATLIFNPFSGVFLAMCTRARNRQVAMGAAYLFLIRTVSLLAGQAIILAGCAAPILAHWVFPALEGDLTFAIYGLLPLVGAAVYLGASQVVYLVMHRSGLILSRSLISLVLVLLASALLAPVGTLAVCLAVTIATTLAAAIFSSEAARLVGLPFRSVLLTSAPLVLACSLVCFGLGLAHALLTLSVLTRVAICCSIESLTYAVLVWLLNINSVHFIGRELLQRTVVASN